MRDHSSYAPAVLKTLQPETSIHKKMKQNNNNNNFIIQTRSQKSNKYIGNMGEFLKSALGFNQD